MRDFFSLFYLIYISQIQHFKTGCSNKAPSQIAACRHKARVDTWITFLTILTDQPQRNTLPNQPTRDCQFSCWAPLFFPVAHPLDVTSIMTDTFIQLYANHMLNIRVIVQFNKQWIFSLLSGQLLATPRKKKKSGLVYSCGRLHTSKPWSSFVRVLIPPSTPPHYPTFTYPHQPSYVKHSAKPSHHNQT